MHDLHGSFDFEDDDTPRPPKRADRTALRILARWIALHDGVDPASGALVERDFVVLDAPGA